MNILSLRKRFKIYLNPLLLQMSWTERTSVFVGGLYWWTTTRDLIDAAHRIGVRDVSAISMYEDRRSGKSQACMPAEKQISSVVISTLSPAPSGLISVVFS